MTEPLVPQRRLDSWKSIGEYLGRSTRTVQRWYATYGLPIHRLGGNKGVIFAYGEELDQWLRSHESAQDGSLAAPYEPAASPQPDSRQGSTRHGNSGHFSAISASDTSRAAELLSLSKRMWQTLSIFNLPSIARLARSTIDLDPGNPEAFASLSGAWAAAGFAGLLQAPRIFRSARYAVRSALELDPRLPEARCIEAWLKILLDRNYRGAQQEFELLLKPNPLLVPAMAGQAIIHIGQGNPAAASVLLAQAMFVQPLSTALRALYCWSGYLRGEYVEVLRQIDEARAGGDMNPKLHAIEALAITQTEGPEERIRQIETLIAISPGEKVLRGLLGHAYATIGQTDRAREILREISGSGRRQEYVEPYATALVLAALNEKEKATKSLEESWRMGSMWSIGFCCDPLLAGFRVDPQFAGLVNPARPMAKLEFDYLDLIEERSV